MTVGKSLLFSRSATLALLLLPCAQSNALARAGGIQPDLPFSSERIDRLPSEIQTSVHHLCKVRPTAAQYFATYLDNSRIIKLHFEHFNCEGQQTYRESDRCLREEFVLSGTHYRLLKTYYGQCGDWAK